MGILVVLFSIHAISLQLLSVVEEFTHCFSDSLGRGGTLWYFLLEHQAGIALCGLAASLENGMEAESPRPV